MLLQTTNTTISLLYQFGPIVLIIVLMYFILIRPQKKKEKEVQRMRSSLEIGDEITTIGGIIGRVVSMKEDTIVIETGSDRSKIRLARWAIQSNNTPHEVEATPAKTADKAEKKAEK